MKKYNEFLNEDITKIMKPKSEEEILNKLGDLSILDRINNILKYDLDEKLLPSDEEIENELGEEYLKVYKLNKQLTPYFNSTIDVVDVDSKSYQIYALLCIGDSVDIEQTIYTINNQWVLSYHIDGSNGGDERTNTSHEMFNIMMRIRNNYLNKSISNLEDQMKELESKIQLYKDKLN